MNPVPAAKSVGPDDPTVRMFSSAPVRSSVSGTALPFFGLLGNLKAEILPISIVNRWKKNCRGLF